MTNLATPLCDFLGITHPIVLAPVSTSPDLVAAVSNAGGLGVLQATWLGAQRLGRTIADIQRLTDRPFGVNFVISLMDDDSLDVAFGAQVPVVSTFWGDPGPLVERIHGGGAKMLHTVGSAQEARRVVDTGVDAVVAQGVEAGGHVWGEVATMVLVPAVVDAVPDIPVIAAGGIADGRGLAAVLALGADAAWVGTRFLLAREATVHPAYRERIEAAKETDTVLSSAFDIGWPDAPHRCLKNDTLQDWIDAGRPLPGSRPNEGEVIAHDADGKPLARYSMDEPLDGTTGNVTSMAMYAGQSAGLVTELKPAAQIVEDMVLDASSILSRLGNS
jgi:NAD(P)H-dependent flavin oxidoreductase YrpB (nitropropane dioxygenase family)